MSHTPPASGDVPQRSPDSSASSSDDEPAALDADDTWQDLHDDDDREQVQFVCLLSDDAFSSLHAMLEYDGTTNGCDLVGEVRRLGWYEPRCGVMP